MVFDILRKLLDPNYATKRVGTIREDTNKKLKKASSSADKVARAARKGDVTMVLFIVAGGKR